MDFQPFGHSNYFDFDASVVGETKSVLLALNCFQFIGIRLKYKFSDGFYKPKKKETKLK